MFQIFWTLRPLLTALLVVLLFPYQGAKADKPTPIAIFFGPAAWLKLDFYAPIARALRSRHWQIEAIDFPCHDDLGCWRQRLERNPQFLSNYIAGLDTQIDALATTGPVVAIGVSRGAFLALAASARYPQIHSVIGLSPLVDLTKLDEFRGFTNPSHATTDLYPLAAALAKRSIFMEIEENDPRVGTQPAIDLARLVASHGIPDMTLVIAPGAQHTEAPGTFDNAIAWVERRIGR